MSFLYNREKSKPDPHFQRLAARGEGIHLLFTETDAEVPVCDTFTYTVYDICFSVNAHAILTTPVGFHASAKDG